MLKGLKILQFQGLAPSVFLGMYFADQGADVILVARPEPQPFSMEINMNILNRNKKCIKLSLKNLEDKNILKQMIKLVDVIIDPYRPGILQKEKLGPEDLYAINPKIILLRVTGYGQHGWMSLKPGHDLNYISSSGILKLINKDNDGKLQFPANYLADFVSSSLGIVGTLKAISRRDNSGEGCVVDCSLAGGCSYLTSLINGDQEIKNKADKQKISYFKKNDKRYVITHYKDCDKTSNESINSAISEMELKNEPFFKNDSFQVAQIKKIARIKDSKQINPFGLPLDSLSSFKIPSRDQNRKQILNQFNIPLARL